MRHLSRTATAAMIVAAALAAGACSRSRSGSSTNTATKVETLNSLTPGNDASALESIGTPASNTVAPLPPVTTNTPRAAANSAADLPAPPVSDEPRPTGNRSSGVQSNVSGM